MSSETVHPSPSSHTLPQHSDIEEEPSMLEIDLCSWHMRYGVALNAYDFDSMHEFISLDLA